MAVPGVNFFLELPASSGSGVHPQAAGAAACVVGPERSTPGRRCGVGYGLLDPARGPGRQVAGRSKPLPPGGKMYIYPSRDNAEYDPTLHISTSGSPR